VAQLTGLRADEVLGRHLLTLVEESSLPNVQRVLSLALRGMCSVQLTLAYLPNVLVIPYMIKLFFFFILKREVLFSI